MLSSETAPARLSEGIKKGIEKQPAGGTPAGDGELSCIQIKTKKSQKNSPTGFGTFFALKNP